MDAWLITVAQLPTEDPAARMRVLRTLESLGAAVVREGAYLLPDTAANRQALDALADYVAKSAGTAHVLQVNARSEAQQEQFQRLFDRSARYEELIKTVESLRVGFGHSDPSAIARVLHKQRREFEAIAALDFFPTQARNRAERALTDAEAAVRELLFASQSQAAPRAGEKLLGRAWATRKPPWADRLACAWLIRRFIDPAARFKFVSPKGYHPLPAEVRFDMFEAEFTHEGDNCTFEVFLDRMGIDDPALRPIAELVHDIDLKDERFGRDETKGLEHLIDGLRLACDDDPERLHRGAQIFEELYAFFRSKR
jgi:hypothetical protein